MPQQYYAGIGSRETPESVQHAMKRLADNLFAWKGLSLRSGHADGADLAFEAGALEAGDTGMEIFVPWPGFNGAPKNDPRYIHEVPDWAIKTVDEFHPAPDRLSPGARKLMARNAMQILGRNGDDPVKFIVCWTKDGKNSGGTGQALRIAQRYKIQVYNLQHQGMESSIRQCESLVIL